MNKIYKLVWSKTRNMYVAVSELAKRRSKSPKTGIVGRTVTAGILAAIISCGAVFPENVEAYTYNGQSATVNEIATDNADTMGKLFKLLVALTPRLPQLLLLRTFRSLPSPLLLRRQKAVLPVRPKNSMF